MKFQRTYRVVAHRTGESTNETLVELECEDTNVNNPVFEMPNTQANVLPVNAIVRVTVE